VDVGTILDVVDVGTILDVVDVGTVLDVVDVVVEDEASCFSAWTMAL
jgi:hypothetical protein